MTERVPIVVIVGGGFAELSAAKALRKSPARIILIDRTNHHLFQPLLYQVATSVLAPGQVASPIRNILRKQRNVTVVMGEVIGLDADKKRVFADSVDRKGIPLEYDYLIPATGATHSYFGHNEFENYAPGLKSLADAVAVRNKILQAFEQAETEEDPAAHRNLLTFVLVGGGPADKGTMAVVGQGYAVLQSHKLYLKGILGWMAWASIHILFLAQPGLRISVFLQWMWTFLTKQRGSRLIVNYHGQIGEAADRQLWPGDLQKAV
jgi:NADH dehydrogenase FAD-containing subunit